MCQSVRPPHLCSTKKDTMKQQSVNTRDEQILNRLLTTTGRGCMVASERALAKVKVHGSFKPISGMEQSVWNSIHAPITTPPF